MFVVNILPVGRNKYQVSIKIFAHIIVSYKSIVLFLEGTKLNVSPSNIMEEYTAK